MKKITLILLLNLAMYAGFAQVQRKTTSPTKTTTDGTTAYKKEQSGENGTNKEADRKKMMKELNLTKDQKGKLKEMRQANKAKREEVNNDASLTEDQKKEKLKAIHKAGAATMQAILTEEQRKKMKEMKKEKMEENTTPVQ